MAIDFRHDLYVVHEEEKEIYHFVRHDGIDELEERAGDLKLNARLESARQEEQAALQALTGLQDAGASATEIDEAEKKFAEANRKVSAIKTRIKTMQEHLADGAAVTVIPEHKVLSSTNGTCYLINLGALKPDKRDWVPRQQERLVDNFRRDVERDLESAVDELDRKHLESAIEMLNEHIEKLNE